LKEIGETLAERETQLSTFEAGKQGLDTEWQRKLSGAQEAAKKGAILILRDVAYRRVLYRGNTCLRHMFLAGKAKKAEKTHKKKMQKAKQKVQENIVQVQGQVSKINLCRANWNPNPLCTFR